MKAVFISDAHLKHSADERYVRFMQFLDDLREVEASKSLVDAWELDGKHQLTISILSVIFLISGFAGAIISILNSAWWNITSSIVLRICAENGCPHPHV